MRYAGVVKNRGGEEPEVRDRTGNVQPARQGDRLAAVVTFETRKLLEVLLDEICEPNQELRSLSHRGAGPTRKSGSRCTHRRIDIARIAVWNLRNDVPRCGADVIEERARGGWRKLAIDEVLEFHC